MGGRLKRYTNLLAAAIIVWLGACGNVDKVAKTIRSDWKAVNSIMERAVERGLLEREDEVHQQSGHG